MFKHFILTRFNLKRDDYNGLDKNNQPVMTIEWLEKRFSLFEKYCLPSIINQSKKNFIWFILFDTYTPDRFVNLIRQYEQSYIFLKPLYIDSGSDESIRKVFNGEMPRYLQPDDRYVITSRIDNDDAFHEDMIREVQNLFKRQRDSFLSFTYGLQYDLKLQVLTRWHYRNNHFISRIEEISDGIETVLTHDHTQIDKSAKVEYINNKNKPLWLELVHEGNLVNYLYPTAVPLFKIGIPHSFNIENKVSSRNTSIAYFQYVKLRILLVRAKILRRLGIYEFLKGSRARKI